MFDKIENTCVPFGTVDFEWSMKEYGFGRLYFYEEHGKVFCGNECMNRETIKKILCQMVDDCTLLEQ